MADTLEALMLISFGCSWPLSLVKNYKSRTAKSMSLPFILLIIFGYMSGIGAKLVQGKINYVLIVYILNLSIVTLNLLVYFRNRRLDKKEQTSQETGTKPHKKEKPEISEEI